MSATSLSYVPQTGTGNRKWEMGKALCWHRTFLLFPIPYSLFPSSPAVKSRQRQDQPLQPHRQRPKQPAAKVEREREADARLVFVQPDLDPARGILRAH